ncbi:hypothetical protein G3N59_13755 [Paraburkholderia sp. Ac-20340]|uniref:hypothetical protein n=1 Tax=Paraburkholderia sp. Ac-20340 TaxID=2703888 RepID=UPI00197CC67D|nr:hypothetical protein [Paraburkholderia sp. Ac-20340]MBN3854447.1 hypothetical protein [Paraburkholderia sp. Ac-20340]
MSAVTDHCFIANFFFIARLQTLRLRVDLFFQRRAAKRLNVFAAAPAFECSNRDRACDAWFSLPAALHKPPRDPPCCVLPYPAALRCCALQLLAASTHAHIVAAATKKARPGERAF